MANWNPWHGCRKYSEGCQHCYVYRIDSAHGKDASQIFLNKDFDLPMRRRRDKSYLIPPGSRVYTCFSSDFLLEEADLWRDRAWEMIRWRSDLQFLFITKRILRLHLKQCGRQNIGKRRILRNNADAAYTLRRHKRIRRNNMTVFFAVYGIIALIIAACNNAYAVCCVHNGKIAAVRVFYTDIIRCFPVRIFKTKRFHIAAQINQSGLPYLVFRYKTGYFFAYIPLGDGAYIQAHFSIRKINGGRFFVYNKIIYIGMGRFFL